MRLLLPRPRVGLTLLEVLVVLAILAITASLVSVAARPTRLPTDANNALQDLVQRARREAVRRGESVRLRVDADGVWAVVADQGGVVVESGRIAMRETERAAPTSIRIDALGTCFPAAPNGVGQFDMLHCRAAGDSTDGAVRSR